MKKLVPIWGQVFFIIRLRCAQHYQLDCRASLRLLAMTEILERLSLRGMK